MQKSLKTKLQHVVSNVTSFAGTDSPALFVGGRRRNRKKRKTKNGQAKRRNKKAEEAEFDPEFIVTSFTPDFEYYKDVSPRRPLVTCVDLEDPVFVRSPIKRLVEKTQDRDSLYSSNESLNSIKSRNDSGCEQELSIDDETNEQSTDKPTTVYNKKTQRTHSKDSGVYDDYIEVGDDALSDQGIASDTDDSRRYSFSSTKEGSIAATGDVDEILDNDTAALVDNTEQEWEEISLTNEPEQPVEEDILGRSICEELEAAQTEGQTDETEDEDKAEQEDEQTNSAEDTCSVKIVTSLSQIADRNQFLSLVEDDDDIIFDLSQLELNNTENVLSKLEFNKQLNEGSNYGPTVLEDEVPFKLPMDLLIDDDNTDEVLYDAGSKRELNITCNPLYEQTLEDDEDRLSVQTFQSGFQTNFDNVKFIQLPKSASNKTSKESSPLLKNRPNFADEIPCCVIL